MWFDDRAQFTEPYGDLYNTPGLELIPLYSNGKPYPWKEARYKFEATKGRNHALLMSSLPTVVCVDLDGKNDFRDVEFVKDLPPTLAELSKSGDGFHLFYSLEKPYDVDLIGRDDTRGVDIKSKGLVFRMSHQLFNNLRIAPAPECVVKLLDGVLDKRKLGEIKNRRAKARRDAVRAATGLTEEEYYQKLTGIEGNGCSSYCYNELPKGERNGRIFAMGVARFRQGDPLWAEHMRHAASANGMEDEIENSINQISKYT